MSYNGILGIQKSHYQRPHGAAFHRVRCTHATLKHDQALHSGVTDALGKTPVLDMSFRALNNEIPLLEDLGVAALHTVLNICLGVVALENTPIQLAPAGKKSQTSCVHCRPRRRQIYSRQGASRG